MELLKVLAMPFQVTSLLFVAGTSLLLGLVLGSGNHVTILMGLWGTVIVVAWLTRYAYRMIDDVANGVRRTAVAEVEMANPFGDARCWVHPAIAAAVFLTYYQHPEWPAAPALIAAALLFPPSIAASAMSGRALDSLNPASILRAVLGFGPWFPVCVLATAGCAALGVVLVRQLEPGWLLFACLELLLLLAYACIGGIVHLRRLELGFAPRISPERVDEKREQDRLLARQKLLDTTFEQLRGRHADRALADVSAAVRATAPHLLTGDLQALLAAGRQWRQPREFSVLLSGLLPVFLDLRQHSLAVATAEAGLATTPSFAAGDEATTSELAMYALQTGRRRMASQLVENHLRASPAGLTPRLAALRDRLAQPG